MKLLTQELRHAIPALYSQENVQDPTCVVKFFAPWNGWTWFAYEGQPVFGPPEAKDLVEVDFEFFGLVVGFETELGYFYLSELQSATGPAGLKIERDINWTPTPLSEVKRKHGA